MTTTSIAYGKVDVMDLSKMSRAEEIMGGKFRLATILQKRALEIMRGSPPLVNFKSTRPIEIALEEVVQGKITLEPAPEGSVEAAPVEAAGEGGAAE